MNKFIRKSVKDIESAFVEIQSILKSQAWKKDYVKRFDLIAAFGLAVTNFLVDEKGYELIYREGYENYNPYTEVLVKHDEIIQDIVSTSYTHLV